MKAIAVSIVLGLVCAAPTARAADAAALACLDAETPVNVRDAIVAAMRDAKIDGAVDPALATVRGEAMAALDRCRLRNGWNDQAVMHAKMAYIAKLGMSFSREAVVRAGFDPERVTIAARSLPASQRIALRTGDRQAVEAFLSALSSAGVFPKTYEQGKAIGVFAGFSALYDESIRLFALD